MRYIIDKKDINPVFQNYWRFLKETFDTSKWKLKVRGSYYELVHKDSDYYIYPDVAYYVRNITDKRVIAFDGIISVFITDFFTKRLFKKLQQEIK
jgi:hypothetical protein